MVTIVLLNVACTCTTPVWTTRFSFFLKLFFLPAFAGAFAIRLRLTRRLLLVGHRAAARSLARAGVGVGPLSPHRQTATVAESAVRAHLDVTLDVHRDLFAEVVFYGALFFDNLADAVYLVLTQIPNLLVEVDARPMQQRFRPRPADTVDVSETDLGSLGGRQIHTGNTRHS